MVSVVGVSEKEATPAPPKGGERFGLPAVQNSRIAADKQHAHELIEQLPPSRVSAATGMLKSLLDPVAPRHCERSDGRRARERGRAQSGRQVESLVQAARWAGIPHEEVPADFGLSPDDLKSK